MLQFYALNNLIFKKILINNLIMLKIKESNEGLSIDIYLQVNDNSSFYNE